MIIARSPDTFITFHDLLAALACQLSPDARARNASA